MGLYYSGGLDWTFTSEPILDRQSLMARVPQSEEYARYADAHYRELVHRYEPAVLWNDISYPKAGKIPELFADYYNTVPDGVIDDRFGVEFSDFTTPEYAKYDAITKKKWEACRGLGFSFGYNQNEGPDVVIAADKLIALLIDVVSKNGNLLLNIGPKADGTISQIQMDRLNKLGAWLDVNGEGIFGTRPWIRAEGASGKPDVRFTEKSGTLYAFLLQPHSMKSFTIPGITALEGTKSTFSDKVNLRLGSRKGKIYASRVKSPGCRRMRSDCAFTLLHEREWKYYDDAVAMPACTGPVDLAKPGKEQLWFLNLGEVSICTLLCGLLQHEDRWI